MDSAPVRLRHRLNLPVAGFDHDEFDNWS